MRLLWVVTNELNGLLPFMHLQFLLSHHLNLKCRLSSGGAVDEVRESKLSALPFWEYQIGTGDGRKMLVKCETGV